MWLKASLIGLALCAIAFALTRPGWGLKKTTVHRKGRDIVFIVDVSRSMLAEDLLPNRLERAKIAIRDLMDDRPHRIRVRTSDPRRLASALVDGDLVTAVQLDGAHVVVHTTDIDAFGRKLAPLAVELGVRLTEVNPLDDDLESVFRYLVEGR